MIHLLEESPLRQQSSSDNSEHQTLKLKSISHRHRLQQYLRGTRFLKLGFFWSLFVKRFSFSFSTIFQLMFTFRNSFLSHIRLMICFLSIGFVHLHFPAEPRLDASPTHDFGCFCRKHEISQSLRAAFSSVSSNCPLTNVQLAFWGVKSHAFMIRGTGVHWRSKENGVCVCVVFVSDARGARICPHKAANQFPRARFLDVSHNWITNYEF